MFFAVPAAASHHSFNVTNNASQRINAITMVYHLADGSTIQRAYDISIPLRVIKNIAVPDSVSSGSGYVDVSNVCDIDLAIGYANGTSVWLTGQNLCSQRNVEARDSYASAFVNAQYATPIPDLTPAPAEATASPQPVATPRTPTQEAVYRGGQLFNAGNFRGALPYFNRALRLDSRNTLAYAYRSRTHFLLNEFAASLNDADAGLRIEPQYALLHWIRANTEWASRLYDSAIEDYGVVESSSYASNERAYFSILSALAARESGDAARAKTLLASCASTCTGDKNTLRILAFMQGKITSRDLLIATSDKYDLGDVHATLGFALLERGKTAEAASHFRWILDHTVPVDNWRPLARDRLGAMGGVPKRK